MNRVSKEKGMSLVEYKPQGTFFLNDLELWESRRKSYLARI